MQSAIDWNITAEEYVRLYSKVRRSNLLQSLEYGMVSARRNNQRPRYGRISIDGEVAGIFQILEASVFGQAFHALILDRGPLWLEGFDTKENNRFFFCEFNKQFPRRPGRSRRIIPEAVTMPDIPGYKRLDRPGYKTIWLDLGKPEKDLRAGLKQKWRSILNKSERQNVKIEWDNKGILWPELRAAYVADRKNRGYSGPAPEFLDALVREFSRSKNLQIGRALLNSNYCSGMLIFRHGRSATWQVGWTSQEGRNSGAGYSLLWQACLNLKDRGTDDFDLGGVNDTDASGVRHFKSGLGGQEICLAGHYI